MKCNNLQVLFQSEHKMYRINDLVGPEGKNSNHGGIWHSHGPVSAVDDKSKFANMRGHFDSGYKRIPLSSSVLGLTSFIESNAIALAHRTGLRLFRFHLSYEIMFSPKEKFCQRRKAIQPNLTKPLACMSIHRLIGGKGMLVPDRS